MASAQMPDDFMEELEAHLPPEQPVRRAVVHGRAFPSDAGRFGTRAIAPC